MALFQAKDSFSGMETFRDPCVFSKTKDSGHVDNYLVTVYLIRCEKVAVTVFLSGYRYTEEASVRSALVLCLSA